MYQVPDFPGSQISKVDAYREPFVSCPGLHYTSTLLPQNKLSRLSKMVAETETLPRREKREKKEKKEKKKKEKKRKRKETEKLVAEEQPEEETNLGKKEGKEAEKLEREVEKASEGSNDACKEEEKESKKKDRKRRRDAGFHEEKENKEKGKPQQEDDKEARRKARKRNRSDRQKEKEELMEKVPKVDEHGIAYTKLQIRRMLKRVKRGLPPVPTEEEERERLRNEAQLRREEESELAGMIYKKDEDDEEEPEEVQMEATEADDAENEKEEPEGPNFSDEDEKLETENKQEGNQLPVKKKSKRSKPVPGDYVCQACKNKHQPPHWIYDCPDKITMKGTNQKAKKLRGLNEPDTRKVFVSGLPFDVKPGDVEKLFHACGKVMSCRLVKFGDTGRCNGQAYVSFDTDSGAKKALKLSGTIIDNATDEPKKKQSKKPEATRRKELKLKVSRVLNRTRTKK